MQVRCLRESHLLHLFKSLLKSQLISKSLFQPCQKHQSLLLSQPRLRKFKQRCQSPWLTKMEMRSRKLSQLQLQHLHLQIHKRKSVASSLNPLSSKTHSLMSQPRTLLPLLNKLLQPMQLKLLSRLQLRMWHRLLNNLQQWTQPLLSNRHRWQMQPKLLSRLQLLMWLSLSRHLLPMLQPRPNRCQLT